ncbi:uncharacterized protein BDZ99DRAFT_514152 [Mytilinidion resinicola]|uniref:Uncharacterized protein n=1 Tax=Mytilinidion resinicola TaxID=574789 RepID=A0A6A6ZB57_9PEZI|nr:uncharacterized protein BDZ99DRAFT_514152 [Mytilinidion resinicola]KAF2817929.1 hypothetical protein BDZ99DRAFT_514152 [Mytilinidion resinicola]
MRPVDTLSPTQVPQHVFPRVLEEIVEPAFRVPLNAGDKHVTLDTPSLEDVGPTLSAVQVLHKRTVDDKLYCPIVPGITACHNSPNPIVTDNTPCHGSPHYPRVILFAASLFRPSSSCLRERGRNVATPIAPRTSYSVRCYTGEGDLWIEFPGVVEAKEMEEYFGAMLRFIVGFARDPAIEDRKKMEQWEENEKNEIESKEKEHSKVDGYDGDREAGQEEATVAGAERPFIEF